MKQIRGLWLPGHEVHLAEHLAGTAHEIDGKPTYQYSKFRESFGWLKANRVAVDVGAHCGLWSRVLVKMFRQVHAFEPVAENRECFELNVQGALLYPYALGATRGQVGVITEDGNSAGARVGGTGTIPMRTLDEFAFHDVDLLKVDCVGYELHALHGAEELLVSSRPCVIVEQKPGYAKRFGLPETGAVEYLQSLGAVVRASMSGVYVLSWES